MITQRDVHHVTYTRFRRRIRRRGSSQGPAASTPLSTWGQCETGFEFDTVCQRLDLDSPSKRQETILRPSQEKIQGHILKHEHRIHNSYSSTKDNSNDREPFAVLNKSSSSQHGRSVMKLAAPALLNDYYANLLDCSCNGMIALALGSSVYLWSSETHTLAGQIYPHLSKTQLGRPYPHSQTISSLCWCRDGTALCIGTRQGEIQLWDVEHKRNMRCLPSHMSVVRVLSWKQQLLSSGSILGRIHHHDPRAPAHLVGTAVQQGALCSLQWSPGDDQLASGSTDGVLYIWDSDITGLSRSRQPLTTMEQPSAVKAIGWCPWQTKMIATGGGWRDGQLRIWDTESGTCVASVNTNSQICSLKWAESKRCLVTGHGLPHHYVSCWVVQTDGSLSLNYQLSGHLNRVLHVDLNPGCTQIFSAGADQSLHIWDM
ncbi:cell division cycle protein 20 homolog B-like [Thalassophryne amazonica]|uniref:cell division cycle protein 20 homolog B-like n=1 Tax=Thalassophryne amazonica TaxID=390379 RepID=UPI001471C256|nr:cell division cycle protein 20 homolog B-like [Thalassophryne amazonica]